jgi:hypothetical protein
MISWDTPPSLGEGAGCSTIAATSMVPSPQFGFFREIVSTGVLLVTKSFSDRSLNDMFFADNLVIAILLVAGVLNDPTYSHRSWSASVMTIAPLPRGTPQI